MASNLRQFLDNVKNGECDKVTKWLNKGLDPNFQWKDMGETPLTLAIKLAKPRDMIMTLVSGGAHLDYRAADTMTPLHKAAVAGNYEAIKVKRQIAASYFEQLEQSKTQSCPLLPPNILTSQQTPTAPRVTGGHL
ncbi:hypothetical protein X801_05900 [Opisthorchis viverrini]|uniref:Uncharacterized protein n=1 Tax=Opisthorchis viverrini TaxID=6198 RepID=A0A1S8WV00_OPIVI|nr:hypothetical protein X801_05900 [Opisthorchis viverrini]